MGLRRLQRAGAGFQGFRPLFAAQCAIALLTTDLRPLAIALLPVSAFAAVAAALLFVVIFAIPAETDEEFPVIR